MSERNERIRQMLGFSMIEDEREDVARHPERAAVKSATASLGPSKDELMQALMDGIVLGLADSEGGTPD